MRRNSRKNKAPHAAFVWFLAIIVSVSLILLVYSETLIKLSFEVDSYHENSNSGCKQGSGKSRQLVLPNFQLHEQLTASFPIFVDVSSEQSILSSLKQCESIDGFLTLVKGSSADPQDVDISVLTVIKDASLKQVQLFLQSIRRLENVGGSEPRIDTATGRKYTAEHVILIYPSISTEIALTLIQHAGLLGGYGLLLFLHGNGEQISHYESMNFLIRHLAKGKLLTTARIGDRFHPLSLSLKASYLERNANVDVVSSSAFVTQVDSTDSVIDDAFGNSSLSITEDWDKLIQSRRSSVDQWWPGDGEEQWDVETLFKTDCGSLEFDSWNPVRSAAAMWRAGIHRDEMIGYFQPDVFGPVADFALWLKAMTARNSKGYTLKEPMVQIALKKYDQAEKKHLRVLVSRVVDLYATAEYEDAKRKCVLSRMAASPTWPSSSRLAVIYHENVIDLKSGGDNRVEAIVEWYLQHDFDVVLAVRSEAKENGEAELVERLSMYGKGSVVVASGVKNSKTLRSVILSSTSADLSNTNRTYGARKHEKVDVLVAGFWVWPWILANSSNIPPLPRIAANVVNDKEIGATTACRFVVLADDNVAHRYRTSWSDAEMKKLGHLLPEMEREMIWSFKQADQVWAISERDGAHFKKMLDCIDCSDVVQIVPHVSPSQLLTNKSLELAGDDGKLKGQLSFMGTCHEGTFKALEVLFSALCNFETENQYRVNLAGPDCVFQRYKSVCGSQPKGLSKSCCNAEYFGHVDNAVQFLRRSGVLAVPWAPQSGASTRTILAFEAGVPLIVSEDAFHALHVPGGKISPDFTLPTAPFNAVLNRNGSDLEEKIEALRSLSSDRVAAMRQQSLSLATRRRDLFSEILFSIHSAGK